MPGNSPTRKRKVQFGDEVLPSPLLQKREKVDASIEVVAEGFQNFIPEKISPTEEIDQALSNARFDERYIMSDILYQTKHEIVYDAWDCELDIPVNIKLMETTKVRRASKDMKYQPMEAYFRQKILHPNILTLHRCFKASDDYVAFVLESTTGYISLKHFVRMQGGSLPEMTAKVIYKKVAKTVLHCLQNGMYHQKLTLENVMINPETLDCKIKDLNHAVKVSEDGHLKIFANLRSPPPEYGRIRRWVKSLRAEGYSYRDIYNRKLQHRVLHAEKAVSWACSVLLYEMVTGQSVCSKDHQYSVDLSKSSKEFQGTITKMLEFDPNKRPSLKEVLKLPYFR